MLTVHQIGLKWILSFRCIQYEVDMRKIIFLDIDGVLNSMDYFEQTKDCKGYTEINPEKVKLLKEIVDRTGAEIVLSSTWRDLEKKKR